MHSNNILTELHSGQHANNYCVLGSHKAVFKAIADLGAKVSYRGSYGRKVYIWLAGPSVDAITIN